MINTGFSRHVDILVDRDMEFPAQETIEIARNLIGKDYIEKWFDVSGLGYDKNWMYVIGK